MNFSCAFLCYTLVFFLWKCGVWMVMDFLKNVNTHLLMLNSQKQPTDETSIFVNSLKLCNFIEVSNLSLLSFFRNYLSKKSWTM